MITLAERVKLELRLRSPSEVTELNLDNSHSFNIEGFTDEYVNLRMLSLNNVGLMTFEGLPNLPNLQILYAGGNRISDLNILSEKCPNIRILDLSNNKFRTMKELQPLSQLRQLLSLEIDGFRVNDESFRQSLFDMIPTLVTLEGINHSEESSESDCDDESCSQHTDLEDSGDELSENNQEYSDDHRGKSKYAPSFGKTGKSKAKVTNFVVEPATEYGEDSENDDAQFYMDKCELYNFGDHDDDVMPVSDISGGIYMHARQDSLLDYGEDNEDGSEVLYEDDYITSIIPPLCGSKFVPRDMSRDTPELEEVMENRWPVTLCEPGPSGASSSPCSAVLPSSRKRSRLHSDDATNSQSDEEEDEYDYTPVTKISHNSYDDHPNKSDHTP